MNLPLDQANLAAIFVESIMYGICLTMGAVTTLVFLRMSGESGLANRRLLSALLLMLILATTHMGLSFSRVFLGFILKRDSTPGGPAAYFANLSDKIFIAKNGVFVVQTVLGDSVNIWRCYVVFGKSWKMIVVPTVIMLAGFTSHAADGPIFGLPSEWIKSFHTLMLVTTLYCTETLLDAGAIAYKIASTGHFKDQSFYNLLPVLFIVVETGAIYTSSLVAFLVAFLVNSNGQYIAIDLITPLVPIIFCLIILQVKFHQAQSRVSVHDLNSSGRQCSADRSRTSAGPTFRSPFKFRRNPDSMGVTSFPMQPVAIQISTEAEEHYPREDSPPSPKKDLSSIMHMEV
ncbi:hypothetical protein EVG20_g1889 [Dentipellis fragilis]|uniref:Uncharacterized protein n=1 Tax=Dentipellis fragilis TaxID=205917 RepID=A0A4Y9Z9G6_9AGAM|nr:hypothetical protein EVG20_g1889 [Dentipellis fragilis]